MKKTKMEKGITLLALIITIVVLLILASVTIGAIKNSSIITHSQDTKKQYTEAEIEEKLQLAVLENYLANNGKINLDELEEKLESDFGDNIKIEDGTIIITNGNNEYSYEISEDGIIKKDTSTDSGDSQELAALKKYILGENLSGIKTSEIFTEDYENDKLNFKDSNIEYVYYTSDGATDYEYIAYIKYNDNYYKFRYMRTYLNEERVEITDSSYGVQLVGRIDETSRIGKKVKFNESIWTILYDDETRGLQIISDDCFGNLVFGDENDLNQTISDYNDAINILNNACEDLFKEDGEYINEYIDDVRCVGSNLTNKKAENTTPFIPDDIKDWKISSYDLCGTDYNYVADYDRMVMLGINDIGHIYWLASRSVALTEEDGVFHSIREVYEGFLNEDDVIYSGNKNSVSSDENEGELRPVIKLKSNVKLVEDETHEVNYVIK